MLSIALPTSNEKGGRSCRSLCARDGIETIEKEDRQREGVRKISFRCQTRTDKVAEVRRPTENHGRNQSQDLEWVI